jgi:flagellin-like protein
MKKRKLHREIRKKTTSERAVSPVVSTILLIMVVIVIAIIIILWFRVFIKEAILKEVLGSTKRVEDFCREVSLKTILNEDQTFGVINEGNVPIYAFKLKVSRSDGTASTENIDGNLNPGFTRMFETNPSTGQPFLRSDFESVKVIPILLGKRKSGAAIPVACPEINGVDI